MCGVEAETEEPAGVDLEQLLRIADQDDLRTDVRRMIEERRERSGANHSRFVDHHH